MRFTCLWQIMLCCIVTFLLFYYYYQHEHTQQKLQSSSTKLGVCNLWLLCCLPALAPCSFDLNIYKIEYNLDLITLKISSFPCQILFKYSLCDGMIPRRKKKKITLIVLYVCHLDGRFINLTSSKIVWSFFKVRQKIIHFLTCLTQVRGD